MNKEPKYDIRDVTHWGEVGAGRVIDFIPKGESILAAVPSRYPADDHVGALTVRGVSLEDLGIWDGDRLLCRRNVTRKDVTPETVCIVFIHTTGELVAKKVLYGNNGMVTLRASGGGIKDVYFPENDIEIRGIVFSFQRMADQHGRFQKPNDDIPF